MDEFSFKKWQEYKNDPRAHDTQIGFNDNGDYGDPSEEVETREQLQSLHTQTLDYINEMVIPLNKLINLGGDNKYIQVIEQDSRFYIKTNVTPSGEVTIEYVDAGDQASKAYTDTKILDANEYTDNAISPINTRLTIIQETLELGQTSITITDERITEDSIFSFYTSIYGVNPTNVSVSTGSVTLTFEAQETDMIVGVRIDG